MAAVRKDGCEPVEGMLGGLAKTIGAEVMRNPDGVYVLKHNGMETIFPDEAAVWDGLARGTRIASDNAEEHAAVDNAVTASEKLAKGDYKAEERAALEDAQLLPADNIPDMVLQMKQMSGDPGLPLEMGGGEQAPFFSRPHRGIGQLMQAAKNDVVQWFTRQHAQLMQQGEGGRWLANTSTQYDTSRQLIYNHLVGGGQKGLQVLKKLGVRPEDLGTDNMSPEAAKIWHTIHGPQVQAVKDAGIYLGTEDLVGENGFPTYVNAQPSDITASMVKEAHELRLINDMKNSEEQIAGLLRQPSFDTAVQHLQTNKERLAAKRWLEKQGTSLAGSLAHGQRGEAATDIEQMMMGWYRSASRRLAEAAHFGPNLENIEYAKDMMMKGGYQNKNIQLVDHIMRDVRGKVYLPSSEARNVFNDATRFMLSASGTRHLAQMKIMMMQHGTNGLGYLMKDFAADVGRRDPAELDHLGVSLKGASHEMSEYPDSAFEPRTAEEATNFVKWVSKNGKGAIHAGADYSTMGIHTFINFGRKIAGRMARGGWESYYEKAMKGDRNTLGMFADVFGFGNATTEKGRAAFVEQLKGLNKDQLRARFIKRMSDLEGISFDPKDAPGLARMPLGRDLIQFRQFRWGLHHNIWNQLTSPNYSRGYKMRVAMRWIGSAPISAMDPILRHINPMQKSTWAKAGIIAVAPFGVAAANIHSEMAYKAWEKMLKDKSASSVAYALTMFAVNDAALGLWGDIIQGWNTSNPEIATRELGGIVAPKLNEAMNLGTALWLGGKAAMGMGGKKGRDKAYAAALNSLPLSNVLTHMFGLHKPVKTPAHPALEEDLKKGAKAVGLH